MKDRHQAQSYPLRVPDDLKRWLQRAAVDNRRSLNSEIIVRLEQSRIQQQAKEVRQ